MKYLAICLILLSFFTHVEAQEYVSGVSTEAISMPSLPGTVEGLPATIIESLAKGQFQYQVEIKVPKGVNDLQPDLKLSYNSANGQGDFGHGWSLNIPSISRSTKNGVPLYNSSDRFWGVDGELVKINRDGPNTYYADYINLKQNIYEFDDGRWILHQGDGRKLYFGEESESIISNGTKIFKWMVERIEDTVGNQITFHYEKINGYPYLQEVRYAYKSSIPHYKISFDYEEREDVIRTFKSTFEVQQTLRCSLITVLSGTSYIIRSYELNYDQNGDIKSSSLAEIKQHGVGGADLDPPMPPITFDYYVSSLDSDLKSTKLEFSDDNILPPSLAQSRATMVDMNRDSFPDILETSPKGATVWLNDKNNGFETHYTIPQFISVLGSEQTKLIDVDGDRIVDFLSTGLTPRFFKGGGGYSEGMGFSNIPTNISAIPRYSISSKNVKTIDLNADGRLDIIAREIDSFKSFLSTDSGSWRRVQDFSVNTGAFDLSSPYTFYADMNGDGLVDLFFVRASTVFYLPNTGTGLFGNVVKMGFEEVNPTILKLFMQNHFNFVSDINGDGLSDLISTTNNTIGISLNLGDGSFGDTLILSDVHDDEFSPKGYSITLADINGNGSSDILWTNDFKDWRYIDFSGTFENLLKKIDNGIGLKINVEYELASKFGTSNESLAASLPHPMKVVKRIWEAQGLSMVPDREDLFEYFGGFYHALENDFRGFNLVVKHEVGDSSIEGLYTKHFYEQGRTAEKDHQQMFLYEKSDYSFSESSKTINHLHKKEEHTLATVLTFNSDDIKSSGFPISSETIITESDFDPETPDRQHKLERVVTLDSGGLISSDKKIIYQNLEDILRQEESVLASSSNLDSHITNRVCEQNIYDGADNLLTRNRFFYDSSKTLCSISDGQLTEKQAWTGSTYETKATYAYNSFGSLSSFKDSFEHESTISYEANNVNPYQIINAAGHTKTVVFSSDTGALSSVTDENSLTTSFAYDLYLRTTKIAGPADSLSLPTTEAVYSFGNSSGSFNSIVTKKREKSGIAGTFDTKEYFNGRGKSLYKISEGPTDKYVLEATTYNSRLEEDKSYQKSFVSNFDIPGTMSSVKAFVTTYDGLKRPLLAFNPQHSVSTPSYKEFFYPVGQKVSYDEARKVSYEVFDENNRRVKVVDALENEVNYEFDSLDQMTKITDPQESETLFGYDSQKRRVCKLDPTIGLNLYVYNSENFLTLKSMYGFVSGHHSCTPPTKTTPRIVNYEYNDLINRKTKVDFPTGSGTDDVIYGYDEVASSYPIGKMTSVSFGSGSKTFDYDVYGNQSKTTLTISGTDYSTEKVFDVMGRIEKIIYPTIGSNSLTIKYEFDAGGNLKTIKNDGTNAIYAENIFYSPLAQMSEIEFGNAVKSFYTFDSSDQSYRLRNILTEKTGSPNTTLQDIDYDYDDVSNIISRNDQLNSFLESYEYDDLHRVIEADLGGMSKTWAYDEIGNIISNNGISYTYLSNRKQTINSVGTSTYGFDNFGNISSDASRSYIFDWNNKLRSITKSSNTSTYDYGEDGIRIIKKTPTLTTHYLDKFTELRGANVVRNIWRDNYLLASIDETGSVSFNHQDLLKSSNIRTNNLGLIVKRIEYLPFGDKRSSVGNYDNIKNRFTGQYEDEESDLYNYLQRFYDPVLSRFISADPLYSESIDELGTETQELNLYSYVKNNPIKNIDPNGLWTANVSLGPTGSLAHLGLKGEIGFIVGHSRESGWTAAIYKGSSLSLTTSGSPTATLDVNGGYNNTSKDYNDTLGQSWSTSVSIARVSGGADSSVDEKGNRSTTWNGSFSIFGKPSGVSVQTGPSNSTVILELLKPNEPEAKQEQYRETLETKDWHRSMQNLQQENSK